MRRKANDCPEGQHGPVFDVNGAGLARWRKSTRDGLGSITRAERRAYGQAVEDAVLAMQARQFIREACEANTRPNCASGSWDEFPGDAVRRQQAAALAACPAKERAARSPHEWESAYCEAMRTRAGADWIAPWQRPEPEALASPEPVADELRVAA
jgi:hypothetical protein